jgi:hypothetical protein
MSALKYDGDIMQFAKHHWKDKGFHFELPRINLDTAYGNEAVYNGVRPNMMAVPTKGKLDAYLKYLRDKRQFKVEYHINVIGEQGRFFSKVLEVDPDNKLSKPHGEIRKNGIRLTYSIMSNGKIYTSIELTHLESASDFGEPVELFKIDLFKALSENKLNEFVSLKTQAFLKSKAK